MGTIAWIVVLLPIALLGGWSVAEVKAGQPPLLEPPCKSTDFVTVQLLKRLAERGIDALGGVEVTLDRRPIPERLQALIRYDAMYSASVHAKIPPIRMTLACREGDLFLMPEEVERIVPRSLKESLDDAKAIQLAELVVWLSAVPPQQFLWLSSSQDIPHTRPSGPSPEALQGIITEPRAHREEGGVYAVSLYVWNNVGGQVDRWVVGITTTWNMSVNRQMVASGVGDYEVRQ